MHVDFDPLGVDWTPMFTCAQNDAVVHSGPADAGHGLNTTPAGTAEASAAHDYMMTGGGHSTYPVFSGLPYQRGAGLGSMFRSFLRFLLPIGRQAGAAIGRQGLESGARVLSNVLDGQNLKESLVSEGRAGLKNLLDKAADTVAKSRQSGGGNFDFKRYRQNAAAEPKEGIKSGKKGLFSTMGPPTAPAKQHKKELQTLERILRRHQPGSTPRKRSRTVTHANSDHKKRPRRAPRFDTLGAY
ncbi:hypothetical protein niasHT_019671 [Heterodera trifolii]|uniref:Uncharacterized protein n=1 Tax=Heterodera trifolii TaxID=157864 RepID=A0ABD2LJC3_9BILA